MKVFGEVDVLHWALSDAVVQIHSASKTQFLAFLQSAKRHEGEGKKITFSMSTLGDITGTEVGGKIHFTFSEPATLGLDIQYKPRTRAQENTLRGVERFIFWAENNHRPTCDEDLYWIHEGLIEKWSREEENPVTGRVEPIRTSDPRMDTKLMSRIINGALDELAGSHIPKEVMDQIGEKMKNLWRAWYQWRYEQGDADPLFEFEMEQKKWEDYVAHHSVCEYSGESGTSTDPLVRSHIISKGADLTVYEEPWNWLRVKSSLHVEQHDDGWEKAIISKFPHIKGKIERARQIYQQKQNEDKQEELDIW
jgi:hypothetical protein